MEKLVKRRKQLNDAQLRKFRFYLQEYVYACEYMKEDIEYSLNKLGSKGCRTGLKRAYSSQRVNIKSCEVLLNSLAATLCVSDNIKIPTL